MPTAAKEKAKLEKESTTLPVWAGRPEGRKRGFRGNLN